MKKVPIKVFNKSEHALPEYETEFSAGMDVRADIPTKVTVNPQQRVMILTGLHVAIPDGYEIQVRPRSGMAWKLGATVLNSPGTIDSDYRGEIGVIIVNTSDKAFCIDPGERIGQLVVNEVIQANWESVTTLDDLGETERGHGGFGHTGTK